MFPNLHLTLRFWLYQKDCQSHYQNKSVDILVGKCVGFFQEYIEEDRSSLKWILSQSDNIAFYLKTTLQIWPTALVLNLYTDIIVFLSLYLLIFVRMEMIFLFLVPGCVSSSNPTLQEEVRSGGSPRRPRWNFVIVNVHLDYFGIVLFGILN